MSPDVNLSHAIVAYADIMGYKQLYYRSEDHRECLENMSLLQKYINSLQKDEAYSFIKIRGGTDSFVLIYRYEGDPDPAKVSCLIEMAGRIQYAAFVDCQLLIRGGISMGSLSDDLLLQGDAYLKSYELESRKADWSRIIVDGCVEELLFAEHKNVTIKCNDSDHMANYLHVAMGYDQDAAEKHLLALARYGRGYFNRSIDDLADEKLSTSSVCLLNLEKFFLTMERLKKIIVYHNSFIDQYGLNSELKTDPGHMADVDIFEKRKVLKSSIDAYAGNVDDRQRIHGLVDAVLDDYDRFWKEDPKHP